MDTLIPFLFFPRYPERGTIEGRLKNLRHHYERTCGAKFYKYIITKSKQQIQTDFKIEDTPALVFFCNGTEIDRISDLDEADPAILVTTIGGEESKDETRIKNKLDELCEKIAAQRSDPVQQQPDDSTK